MPRDKACYGCDWLKVLERESPCNVCGADVTNGVKWSDLVAQHKANMLTSHGRETRITRNTAKTRSEV